MTLRPHDCPGCLFGGDHLESCPQAQWNKFMREVVSRPASLTDEIIAAYYQEWRAKYDFSVAHIALVGTPPELPPRWVVDCIQFCLKKGTS